MTQRTDKPTKPTAPPRTGDEGEPGQGDERPEPHTAVKEPPTAGQAGLKDKFPRKGDV
jgi:hypothetical protein